MKYNYDLIKIGDEFGLLTVVKEPYSGSKYGRNTMLLDMQCLCGSPVKTYEGCYILRERYKDCGCEKIRKMKERQTKHGMSKEKIYLLWDYIKSRCYNPNNKYYYNYGGRGIKMCEEWKNSRENFIKWGLINGYQEGLTIDRIDNNGNYCPENCRWATKYEQERNMRKNKFYTAFGETKCISDWYRDSRALVSRGAIWDRINRMGWSMEKALTTPPLPKGNNQYSKTPKKSLTNGD